MTKDTDLLDLLTNVLGLLSHLKEDWVANNCWSEWDEEQLQRCRKRVSDMYNDGVSDGVNDGVTPPKT